MTATADHGPLVILNSNTHTRNIHITRLIFDAARDLLGHEQVHYATYGSVVETCRKLDAPLLLVIDGQRLSLPVLMAAGRLCRATAIWFFDDPYNLGENINASRHFDFVFTNDPSAAPRYSGGATFLPCAGGTIAERVPEDSEKEFDIFFCGSAWPNRVIWLNRLLAAWPALDWRVSLTYNPHLPPYPLDLPESAYLRSLAFEDMQEMAARARVTLDLNRAFGGTDTRAESVSASYPGPRVFELGGRGAFQISLNTPGLREAFAPDEVPMYESVDALAAVLPEWLSNAEARRSAAEKTQAVVAGNHRYHHRLQKIFDVCRPSHTPKSGKTLPLAASRPAALAARPKLLFVVHNVRGDNAFGGLELHQEIVAQTLAVDHDILFFWSYPAEGGHGMAVLDLDYNALETRFSPVPDTSILLQSGSYEAFFSEVLQRYAIDLVHFFHFREVPPSLASVTRSLGVPYTLSLHDYYMIFRNFVLTDDDGTYWGERVFRQNEMERVTTAQWPEAAPGAYARRHAAFARVLREAEGIVHISHAAKKIFETAFPVLRRHGDVRVFHAPLSTDNYKLFRAAAKTRGNGPPRYVALGNMAAHKGGHYLVEALKALPDFEGELHFHGSIKDDIRTEIAALIGDRAVFHGRYTPGALDLTSYDYSLHLSTWPETYCQTLSEAWAMGAVPIVTDIGALGERVTHMKTGLKVDHRHPSSLSAVFDHIAKAPENFVHLRNISTEGLFMDPPVAAAQYGAMFSEVLARRRETGSRISDPQPSGFTLTLLNRAARRDLWTQTGSSATSEPIRPEPVRAPAWTDMPSNRLEIVKDLDGNIDQLSLSCEAGTSSAGLGSNQIEEEGSVHPDDLVNVHGWINYGSLLYTSTGLADATPVVALRAEGADTWSVFDARNEPRSDLAAHFGEAAQDWGIVAAVHIANPRQETSGKIAVRMGLKTASGKVFLLPVTRFLTGHMTKRPRQQST